MVMKTRLEMYILHLKYPDGSVRHYVGSCKVGRFEKRLAEHRAGNGSVLTKLAVEEGAEIVLAARYHRACRQLEHQLSKAPEELLKRAICYECSPNFTAEEKQRLRQQGNTGNV